MTLIQSSVARVTIAFTDEERQTAVTGFYVNATDGGNGLTPMDQFLPLCQTLINDFAAMSVLGRTKEEYSLAAYEPSAIPIASTGAYSDCEDKAFLTFRDAVGDSVTYSVPGPGAIFMADEETVNPANGAVATWITKVLAFAVSAGAQLIVEYLTGTRTRRRTRRGVVGSPV